MKVFLAGEYYKNMGNAIKQIVWGGIVPDETVLSKPSHVVEVSGRINSCDYANRGGIPSNVNENIPCGASEVLDERYRGGL